ncbi:MAG: YeeE/YedE family protein [Sandaracinaceae bacterium]
MEHFTPLESTVGGILIGLSASVLLLFTGRVAGISGIANGVLFPASGEGRWRLAFVGGLLAGGLALSFAAPALFAVETGRALWMVGLAGLLVGYGVRMGSGCTSGHGVCGISRLSGRSIVATLTFITTGIVTVLVLRLLLGGGA